MKISKKSRKRIASGSMSVVPRIGKLFIDYLSMGNREITASIDLEYLTEMTRLIPLTEPPIKSWYVVDISQWLSDILQRECF